MNSVTSWFSSRPRSVALKRTNLLALVNHNRSQSVVALSSMTAWAMTNCWSKRGVAEASRLVSTTFVVHDSVAGVLAGSKKYIDLWRTRSQILRCRARSPPCMRWRDMLGIAKSKSSTAPSLSAWLSCHVLPYVSYHCLCYILWQKWMNELLLFPAMVWRSDSALVSINEVNLRQARLLLRWVTVSGFNFQCRTFISVCDQLPR